MFCPPVFRPWSQERETAVEELRAACCQIWQRSALSFEEWCWGAGPQEGLVPFLLLIKGSHENRISGEENHLGESLALHEVTPL